MKSLRPHRSLLPAALLSGVLALISHSSGAAESSMTPATNHVGKPLSDYLTGGECLFCHRDQAGITWQSNPHAWTVRTRHDEPPIEHSLPAGTTHVIGSTPHFRALHLSGYGRFSMAPPSGTSWDVNTFADRCVGCHATGIDPKTAAFSNYGVDCYACHGDLTEEHANNPELAWLGTKKKATSRQLLSICDQCHLRGAVSRSTGRPYANNFVAGDDLFLDFKVDLKLADDQHISERDRHVYEKTRAVLERGSERTCISCHKIHPAGERKPPPAGSHSRECGY